MGFNHTIRKRLAQEKKDRVWAEVARAKLPKPPRPSLLAFTPKIIVTIMGQPVEEKS